MQVLKHCGDDLARANVMCQVASLHDAVMPMLLPDISISTSPTRFTPINQRHLSPASGRAWPRAEDFNGGGATSVIALRINGRMAYTHKLGPT